MLTHGFQLDRFKLVPSSFIGPRRFGMSVLARASLNRRAAAASKSGSIHAIAAFSGSWATDLMAATTRPDATIGEDLYSKGTFSPHTNPKIAYKGDRGEGL